MTSPLRDTRFPSATVQAGRPVVCPHSREEPRVPLLPKHGRPSQHRDPFDVSLHIDEQEDG